MTVIAMTREMGSLGKDVAREFARRMNYTVIHHEIVESPSARAQQEEESEVYRFLEGSEREIEKWRTNRAKGGYLTREEVFEITLEGDALIRGWGATRLLKSIPNVLSVRVCAPMDFRIEQIKHGLALTIAPHAEILRSDAAHSQTLLRFFEADWRDPLNYDLVMNTTNLSPQLCAEMLCNAVANSAFEETAESRREIRDRLLEARISSALIAERKLGRRGRDIHVKVSDAEVRLFGVVTDGQTRQLAENIVTMQPGVRNLRNDLVRAKIYSE
ncbi:MAG: cytidylate kinase family protein [Rhodobacteraceae bacterium]|nr:cytidylate kinase family protein [Paracoccaceae bacterium]